jgi:phospholipase C
MFPTKRLRTAATLALAITPALACSTPPVPTDASDAGSDIVDATIDTTNDTPADDTGSDALDRVVPPDVPRTASESTLQPRRASCAFDAGAWPAETLGTEIPLGSDIPIDHILVLLMENRSFDSYFSHLPHATGDGGTTLEVPPPGWSNPDSDGTAVLPYHDTQYCLVDTDHEWAGSHAEWNDGFVRVNNPNGGRSMVFYDERDIPLYYSLATTFAIGDHYHCSLLGPTFPNRMYSMAATSFGHTGSQLVSGDTPGNPARQIFLELDEAGVDWKDYAGGPRALGLFPNYALIRRTTAPHLAGLTDLMNDLASGNLPPFSFVEPVFNNQHGGGNESDDHPPGTPMGGQQFVESVVRALMASPVWQRSALFIAYDENGGFADHVPPPAACPPDDHEPTNDDGTPAGFHFDRYGFRVPFIVVSPYARAGFVSHTVYDHTSLLRFVEARFGLPAMTRRDANATPPMEMFDFAHPPFMTPPPIAPSVYDPAVRDRCNAQFPP